MKGIWLIYGKWATDNEMSRNLFPYDLLTPGKKIRVTRPCNVLRSRDTAAHDMGVVHEKTDGF